MKPRRLERVDDHFVWISEDELLEVTSIKKLVEALSNSTELATFAKKQKISPDNPLELMELLNYHQYLLRQP